MKWTILNTLICPQSGIAFSAISSLRFLKFIMWYEADVILLPGESIRLYSSRVLINDQYHSLKIGNDSNLLIVFYVQIMPDDFVMQLHRF